MTGDYDAFVDALQSRKVDQHWFQEYDRFVRRWFTNRAHANRAIIPSCLKPPPHIWAVGANATHKGQAYQLVRIRRRLIAATGSNRRELGNSIVHTVDLETPTREDRY